MSYSNPTWYRTTDPFAVQKSFEKAFTESYSSVESYFNEIDKQLKTKETELQEKAKSLRSELAAMKTAVPYTKAQIEEQVRQFYEENKPSVSREGSNFITRGINTKVEGSTTAMLDEASANFKAMAGYVNTATENFLDATILEKVDKGNPFYLDFAAARQAYKDDPSSMKFKRNGTEFSFEIEIEDKKNGGKKTLTMEELHMGISSLDPEVLKIKKESHDEIQKSINGLAKNAYDSAYALADKQAAETGAGQLVLGEEFAKQQAESWVKTRMNDESVQDVYNNFVDDNIGFSIKYDIFNNTALQDGLGISGATILDDISNIKDPAKKAQAMDAIGKIMDMPINDRTAIEKLIVDADIPVAKDNIDGFFELLNEYKDNVVIEHFTDLALSNGVNSRYIKDKKKKSNSSASRSKGKSSKQEEVSDQTKRAGVGIRDIFSMTSGGGNWSTDKSPTGKFIYPGGQKRQIARIDYNNATGMIDIVYPFGSPDEDGYYDSKTLSYDTRNPYEMQDLYSATGGGKKGYTKEMLKQFDSEEGMSMLDRPGMNKWIKWLDENGYKQKLIDHIALSPGAIQFSHWQDFSKANRKAIDKKILEIARANKK
jgi:hypothetical protein